MTERFVYVGGGYVNLRNIDQAKINKGGRYTLISDDKIVDDNNVDFLRTIVSVVAPQGDWECLSTISEEDGSKSVYAEPVLAWGLTVTGTLLPITTGERSGVEGDFGLRKMGDPRVYAGTTYSDMDSW